MKFLQTAAIAGLLLGIGALIFLSHRALNTILHEHQVALNEIMAQKGTLSRAISRAFFLLDDLKDNRDRPADFDDIRFDFHVLVGHVKATRHMDVAALDIALVSDSLGTFQDLEGALREYRDAAADLLSAYRAFGADPPKADPEVRINRIAAVTRTFVRKAHAYDIALMPVEAAFSRTIHSGIGHTVRLIFYILIGLGLMAAVALAGFAKFARDIRSALRKLRESEESSRYIAENIPGMVYQFLSPASGGRGRFLYMSPASESYLGYSAEAVMDGRAWPLDAVHPEDADQFRAAMARSVKTLSTYRVEHRVVDRHGAVTWLDTRAAPRKQENGDIVWTGLTIDITEQKRMEREKEALQSRLVQARKMEAVGLLAGGIAHEFNNALAIIFGYSDLAMEAVPAGSPAGKYIENIQAAAKRSRDIVRQLLTFSRKGEGRLAPLDLAPVVTACMKLIRSTTPAGIDIRQEIPPSVAPVSADPTQIQQVMIHLCKNAADAVPDGNGRITVQLMDAGPGGGVALVVRDNGEGMPQETVARIFDPFFTTKAVDKGSGMGLAVVHGIVEGHGGTISVKSGPGEGTTVTVRFPSADGPPDHSVPGP